MIQIIITLVAWFAGFFIFTLGLVLFAPASWLEAWSLPSIIVNFIYQLLWIFVILPLIHKAFKKKARSL